MTFTNILCTIVYLMSSLKIKHFIQVHGQHDTNDVVERLHKHTKWCLGLIPVVIIGEKQGVR